MVRMILYIEDHVDGINIELLQKLHKLTRRPSAVVKLLVDPCP